MNLTVKRIIQLLISVGVGAVCLVFAFRGVESGASSQNVSLEQLQELIAQVPVTTLLAFCALIVVQFVVRTERWRVQVKGLTGKAPSWRDALSINALAFAAVFLLPFRLGELVRPNLCAQRGIMSASSGLAASALERIIDGLVTTALFGGLLLLAPHDLPAPVRAGGLTALVVFGSAVVFFGVAFRFRKAALQLVERVAGVAGAAVGARVAGLVGGFLDGLACFRGVSDVVVYVSLSVFYWAINGLSILLVVRAIDPSASVDAGFFCLCFLVIGVMIPAPPGNVGNFHYFARAGLMITGMSLVPAVACAVLLHALTTVTLIAWALVFLVIGGFKWREFFAPPSQTTSSTDAQSPQNT